MYLGLTKVDLVVLRCPVSSPVGPWCLLDSDGCLLSGCKLKAAGLIELIPNGEASNMIHKCLD